MYKLLGLILIICVVLIIIYFIINNYFNKQSKTTKYVCTGTVGKCRESENGSFLSLSDCESSCVALPVPKRYSCTDNVVVEDRYGIYQSLKEAGKFCNLPIVIQPIPSTVGYVIMSALPTYALSPGSNCDIPLANNFSPIFNDHCWQQYSDITIWTNTTDITLSENATVKCHGTASIHWPKKSYNLHYENSFVPEKGIFNPGKKFYLYSPYFELNKIQNPVAYYISNTVGIKSANVFPIELWVSPSGPPQSPTDWATLANSKLPPQLCTTDDGKKTVTLQGGDSPYRGLYWIFENVSEKVGKNNFSITFDRGLCPDDASTILTGYMPFGQDANMAAADRGESRVMILYPDPADDPTAIGKVSVILTDFVTKLFTNEGTTMEPSKAALAMVDYESTAKYFILNELLSSVDGFMYNTFMKAFQGDDGAYVFKFGSVWDMHLAQGSCSNYFTCRDGGNYKFWRYAKQWLHPYFSPGKVRYNIPQIFARLLMSSDFSSYLIKTYQTLRQNELSLKNIMQVIDGFAALVLPKINSEFTRWPTRNIGTSTPYTIPYTTTASGTRDYTGFFQNQINVLKLWYTNRLAFLDANMTPGPAVSPNTGNNQTGLGIVMGKFIPTGTPNPNNYEGNCNNSGGCDFQENPGFFYAQFPSTVPNVFKDFP